MKVLFISNLFPDAAQPNRGIFNARLVHHLARHCEIRVIAPRPTRGVPPLWSPQKFSARAEDAAFQPSFPPSPYVPVIGSRWNHRLMARALRESIRNLRREFPFDVALVAWAYPDACAVAALAAELDFPFVAVAQGSDVHQYLNVPARRRIITTALAQAGSVITCSRELARLLAEAGVAESKLQTIYYGAETDVFRPGDKLAARQELGLPAEAKVILFVGNLLPIKNPPLLVEALSELAKRQANENFRLVMLGEGPLREKILAVAKSQGMAERVRLPGRQPPATVAQFMQAADVLGVPSDNEGVPNVIYEAMSCGLPVVATRVGGIPEIVTGKTLGRLVSRGDATELAEAIRATLTAPPDAAELTAHARQFSWEQTAAAYLKTLGVAAHAREAQR